MRILNLLLPLVAACTLAAQDVTPRVGIFYYDQVATRTVHGRKLFNELELLKKTLEDRIRSKNDEGVKLKGQEASPSISDAGREQIQKQLRDLEFELKKLQDDSQQEFERTRQKVFTQFSQEVGPIIEAVAKEMKFQLVLQASPQLLAYAEDGWDRAFTNEVAKRFDAMYETAGAAAPVDAAPKPAPKPAGPKPAPKK